MYAARGVQPHERFCEAKWRPYRPTSEPDGILNAPTDGAPKNALHESVGRFSYVDLYWENRHLVSGLSFLVYTSEYSISGLRMCLQNGGSAVS